MGKKLLSIADLMQFVGISRPTIYRLMERGLPCYNLGRRRLFARDALIEWVKSHKDEGPKKSARKKVKK